jgi:hypothetical protein
LCQSGEEPLALARRRVVGLSATVYNAFDGLMRVVGDLQRFGPTLDALKVDVRVRRQQERLVRISVPVESDDRLLMVRLSLHASITSVTLDSVSSCRRDERPTSRTNPRNDSRPPSSANT